MNLRIKSKICGKIQGKVVKMIFLRRLCTLTTYLQSLIKFGVLIKDQSRLTNIIKNKDSK